MDAKILRISLESYKAITDVRSFPPYDKAEIYVGDQTSGNYRIVCTNHFSSPLPLEEGLKKLLTIGIVKSNSF